MPGLSFTAFVLDRRGIKIYKIYDFEEFVTEVNKKVKASEDEIINILEWEGFNTEFLDCIDGFLVERVIEKLRD